MTLRFLLFFAVAFHMLTEYLKVSMSISLNHLSALCVFIKLLHSEQNLLILRLCVVIWKFFALNVCANYYKLSAVLICQILKSEKKFLHITLLLCCNFDLRDTIKFFNLKSFRLTFILLFTILYLELLELLLHSYSYIEYYKVN